MLAHIALAVLGLLDKVDNMSGVIDTQLFQMHLYASFPSKAEAVAYELCEALHSYCYENNLKTFTLHPRLSKEKINPARWDESWIAKTLLEYPTPDVQRVWVCGPPVMNETFDRTLMDMRNRLPETKVISPLRIELL